MILLNTPFVKHFLYSIGKNQAWLADRMKRSPSDVSMVLNNKTYVSMKFVDDFKMVCPADFEKIILWLPEQDTRAFAERYSSKIYVGEIDKLLDFNEYEHYIKEKIKKCLTK